MQAFALIGPEEEVDFAARHKAEELAQEVIEKEVTKLQHLKEVLSFTSLRVRQNTAIILKNFGSANKIVQNAFLKSLEEPQEGLFFILTATNEDSLLDTIISRVSVKRLSSSNEHIKGNFYKMSLSDKAKSVIKLKNDRQAALNFIKQIIKETRDEGRFEYIEVLNQAYSRVNAQGNIMLQLTDMLRKMESIRKSL